MHRRLIGESWLCLAVPCLLTLVTVIGCRQRTAEAPVPPPPRRVVKVEYPKARFSPRSASYTNWWIEWSKAEYVDGYQRAGRKDPKWDGPVLAALEAYAKLVVVGLPPGLPRDQFHTNLQQAIQAGCNDPLVNYVYGRLFTRPTATATPDTARVYADWARSVEASGYPTLVKFYVNLRASQAWRAASKQQFPEVNQFRRLAVRDLQRAVEHDEMPAGAAEGASLECYRVFEVNRALFHEFMDRVDSVLIARWPDEGFPYLLKGRFYIEYAWEARGGGWAASVPKRGWQLFTQRLDIAEQALDQAWTLDPSLPDTPLAFLKLELGQGKGRERMETWFQRAIAFPQDRYEAVQQKLWYLQPRWYGSEDQCLAAARQVLHSDLFTNQVPLLLFQTHESLADYYKKERPNYWLDPQVWSDVKASFERYFQVNGEDTSQRHVYAKTAFDCRQWTVFLAQVARFQWTNADYFGGPAAFEDMKRQALAASRQ